MKESWVTERLQEVAVSFVRGRDDFVLPTGLGQLGVSAVQAQVRRAFILRESAAQRSDQQHK